MMIHLFRESRDLLDELNAGQIAGKLELFHEFTAFHLPAWQLGECRLNGGVVQ